MPIHAYRCENGHEYEVLYLLQSKVKLEEKKEKCPECKSKKKKRLPASKTSHVFKSGRWFKEGY